MRQLFDFEISDQQNERAHIRLKRFSNKMASSGQFSAVFPYGKYIHMDVTKPTIGNWQGYDFLLLDIYNPLSRQASFSAAIKDGQSGGYWDQLNHHNKLSPGWNTIRIRLNIYVGERGSVRHQRYLNLAKLKTCWFAIEAEKQLTVRETFYIDNIRLEKLSALSQFAGLKLFDFVTDEAFAFPGFTPVTKLHNYDQQRGYGFRNAHIWRVHDSQYADLLHRDAIIVTKGSFIVHLPNGSYTVRLVPEMLGYWEPPFWRQRKISIQKKVVLKETRLHAKDYLADFLRFSDVEPQAQDNPYDLYMKPIFRAVQVKTQVTNGELVIQFAADPTGVALNALMIWPTSKNKQAETFLSRLNERLKADFTADIRLVGNSVNSVDSASTSKTNNLFRLGQVRLEDVFMQKLNLPQVAIKQIKLQGGTSERPYQMVKIDGFAPQKKLQVQVSDLKSAKHVIKRRHVNLSYAVNRFVSQNANHETYALLPSLLRQLPADGLVDLNHRSELYLWVQIPVRSQFVAGRYQGNLTIRIGRQKKVLPLTLNVFPYQLPRVDFPVGFLGIQPIDFAHFTGVDVEKVEKEWTRKALTIIADRGFTTWSGLPVSSVAVDFNQQKMELPEMDAFMAFARGLGFTGPIFSYGSLFFDRLLSGKGVKKTPPMSINLYKYKLASLLKSKMKGADWLPIVFTFSDEAGGFSNRLEKDVAYAQMLKKSFPLILRGGFSSMIQPQRRAYQLNMLFTDGSYSNVDKKVAAQISSRGARWGVYNAAAEPHENPRFSMGEGLYIARKHGLSHRLAWHFSGWQNYPYYDLDGREYDAAMVYPRMNGLIDTSLKFELATTGLEDYRLLTLLETLLPRCQKQRKRAKLWLKKWWQVEYFAQSRFLSRQTSLAPDFVQFRAALYQHLRGCLGIDAG